MPEPGVRLPCPVCLGVMMERAPLPGGLVLDHCGRCGGVWFDASEIQAVRSRPPTVLWETIPRRTTAMRPPCHACHAPLAREAERCPACDHPNRLRCPGCQREMSRVTRGDVVVDACGGCRGVWLDHSELAAIWGAAFATAVVAAGGSTTGADLAGGALEAAIYAPDLAVYAAHGAATVGGEVLAAAPEVAAAAAEGVLSVAAHAFELVLETVLGLLSGL